MAKKIKEKYTGSRVVDTDTFIQKARWVHGDKYDYSKVEYKTQKQKVEIICEDHGSFWQNPNDHATGSNCPACYLESKRKDTSEFIRKAKDIHGDRYDYSKTNYTGKDNKVTITCREHGDFKQTANNHVHTQNKSGCPECAGRTKLGQTPYEWFVSKSRGVHGKKYDYSNSEYSNSHSRIEIICRQHGTFIQSPTAHLRGQGCPLCGKERQGIRRRLNTSNKFIASSREVHGGKYDYSLVDYEYASSKIKIICPDHGIFQQTPNKHLSGQGCLECVIENSGWGKSGYYGTEEISNIYVLKIDKSFIKVGLAKEIHIRMNTLLRESGYSVEKLYSISGKANELFELEQKILRKSNLKRFYPEVPFGGQSECLHLSELPKVLAIIEDWEKNQQSEEKLEEFP